jgi:hypothetical protein
MRKTIILFVLALICFSCGFESDMKSLSIGGDFIDARTTISVVDSFTVSLSTVKIDSLTTSGNNILWAGKYIDKELGSISSIGYYEVGIPENTNVLESDSFDSLLLVMNSANAYYGDTSLLQSFQIYRLTEQIKGDENGNLWNHTSIAYNPNPIGTVSFKPKPSSKSKIKIRLSDQIGRDFLDLMQKKDESIATFEKFREYFKGIAIGPGNSSSVILAFLCDSSMNLELHTHRKGLEKESLIQKFPLGSTSTYFNHFVADRTGTPISQIVKQLIKVPSSQSNNKTYVESGIGLLTRVDFPTMQQLMETDRKYVLLKAELILIPEPGTYKQVPLPSQLVLYHTDKSNRVVSEIVGDQNATLAGDLVIDRIYNENTSYTFDITDFITTEISDSYFDTSHGLLIGETSNSIGASLNRVVFCDRKNSSYKPLVRLYFMHYNL